MRRESKYATPRKKPARKVPIGWMTALICLFVMGLVALAGWVLFKQVNEAATAGPSVKYSSLGPTHTYNGETIRWYVFVDPDSQVQYLVNDRGGCCPRLDGFGHAMGTQYHEGGD